MTTRLFAWCLLALALSAATSQCADGALVRPAQAPYPAICTAVDDGDTIWVKRGVGAAFKVRLHWSDCPEIGHNSKEIDQPYGQEAKKFAADAVLNKTVTIKNRARSYDRIVGDVTEPDGMPLGLDLVKHGLAQLDPRYDPPADWLKAQDDSKKAKAGLWAEKNPKPPWKWRKDGDAKKK